MPEENVTHQPDITRIPNSLLSLDWQPVTPETEWYDGMLVMFAVPVCHYHRMRARSPEQLPWRYEFVVVAISVYDNSQGGVSMSCEVDGNPWGWEPCDADWYVVIRG
jgi:hypothetical protein